jgi:hypothetical protein
VYRQQSVMSVKRRYTKTARAAALRTWRVLSEGVLSSSAMCWRQTREAAEAASVRKFKLSDEQRTRLVVQERV